MTSIDYLPPSIRLTDLEKLKRELDKIENNIGILSNLFEIIRCDDDLMEHRGLHALTSSSIHFLREAEHARSAATTALHRLSLSDRRVDDDDFDSLP
jgi:hypothetical protein